jgi:uncharacterized protein (DUF58 family)
MMVREFEARQNRDVLVLLDPWLPASPEPRDRELLELAISFVATVCVELCEHHGIHLVLGVAAESPAVRHGESSPHFLMELLEQLALIQGTPDTDWDNLLRELPATWTNQMHITAVSPRVLNLADRLTSAKGSRFRWRNVAQRISEIDVARPDLREVFQLL